MEDCIFCKIIGGDIPSTKVYEDEDMVIIKDIAPQAPVHLLLLPKQHYPDIIAGGTELLKRGPQNVIVSMGGSGSYFFAGDGSIYHVGVATGYPFINPVGTGDSSIAGFIKGYVQHRSIEDCLRLMAAAGGATAFSNGLGSLELTEKLAATIKVEKIR